MRHDAFIAAAFFLASGAAWAEMFESWEDAVRGGYTVEKGGENTARLSARAEMPASAEPEAQLAPLVRFGAGAAYLVALRPADLAGGEHVMSEFFVGFSPWRWRLELGAELALSRDSRFFLRPNFKLLLVNGMDFALYLEGDLALYSHPGGLEVGCGGALGGSVGLLENLALEVFASATIFDLSRRAAATLVGAGGLNDTASGSSLVVLPSAGARLVARF